MTTLAKQPSLYGEWTDSGVTGGVSVLVQNQSSIGVDIYIFTGTEPPEDFEGILLRDWISFPVKDGEKLFHTAAQEIHETFNHAAIRVDMV
ncbi:Whole genome shotgun sequence [Vibrio owensii]|uniref:Whole genome shotgun sequence n=1 Tax=Vibrio owensii TaxID=696485 RepID=A0AAU9PYX4_9VIBR|nr:Whole genome shotgun sequence [Vibrio owensii]